MPNTIAMVYFSWHTSVTSVRKAVKNKSLNETYET